MSADTISARLDEKEIDAIFADVDQCQLPGLAVAIAIDGTPVYRKGFGLANIELPVRLSPSMRMRIGSTTKHFACLAYMLLCEEGRAGIDDPIGKHVPGLRDVTARTTMRQLMGHTSGIRDLLSITTMMNGMMRPVTEKQMLAYYASIDDADFEPGTHWSYNNGAYMLLTAAIEAISGESLDEVLRKRILEPAGMYDTMLRRWDTSFVPNSATLHFRDASGTFSRYHMGMELSGMGGMVSTMDDMLRWLKHMDAPVVGSAETWALMREPHRLSNGVSTGYGLGLMTELYRGVEVVHHAGGVLAGNSQMIKVPAAKLDISVAVNRADVSGAGLAFKIIDQCVQGLAPLPEPTVAAPITGTYVSQGTGRVVTLSAADDKQLLSIDGGSPIPMSSDADGVLQLPSVASFLQQTARKDGDDLVISDFGKEDRLAAVIIDAKAKLGERVGTYRSDGLDTDFVLREDADGARIMGRGRHGLVDYRMTPFTADIWRIEQGELTALAAILTFDADGRGLTIDTTRMRHIRFTRVD